MFGVKGFTDGVVEGVTLTEFVVVVFSLVSFLQIEVIVCEKVVMVLRTHHLGLHFSFHFLVWVKVGGFVLPQLVVVIFVVKIVGGKMVALSRWVAKLF